MDSSTSLQKIIDYRFKHDKLLNEAILAAGASVSDPHVDGDKQGNKSLALIGDALIRLAIADRGHAQGARAVESTNIVADRGSNISLEEAAHELDLGRFIVPNPSQRGLVPRTTLASLIEALVGAVWLDSARDFDQVRRVMNKLGILDDNDLVNEKTSDNSCILL